MDSALTLTGLFLTAAGAVLLYLASEHQRLLARRPSPKPLLMAGGICLLAGAAAWVGAWGGLVGGLLALAVWMTVSVALPYLLARRSL